MVNHHEFKSVWELGLMISDENNNQSQPSRTHTHTNKVHVISFIMLFILTIGYIGKVYKSVSSKRKPTRPSVGNVCVILLLLFMCELDRDAGSPLLFSPPSPPAAPLYSSDQQWTPSSQCTVQGEDICLFLRSGARCSLVS